jgi:hypothetical protein
MFFFLQRFIMILSEHLVRCDTDGIDYKTPWYQWTVGRLQQIFMMVSNHLKLKPLSSFDFISFYLAILLKNGTWALAKSKTSKVCFFTNAES